MNFSFLKAKSPDARLRARSRLRDYKLKAGFGLVEILIGTALILISLVGLMSAYSFYLRVGLKSTGSLKAVFLLEEGAEAVTLLRDDAWAKLAALSTSSTYFLIWSNGSWETTTTVQLIDGSITRTVTISDVFRRNSDSDIVATSSPDAKTFDPNTKKITVRVNTPRGIDKKLETYLANLFE